MEEEGDGKPDKVSFRKKKKGGITSEVSNLTPEEL